MATETKRGSFIFYRSFLEAIQMLEAEDAKTFTLALGNYALDMVEPELCGVLKLLWTTVKPQLEANNKRYENGKKGGAPKGSHNNPNGRRGKTSNTQDAPVQAELNSTIEQTYTPTIENVRQFFAVNQCPTKADEFFNYYQSTGWKSHNTPIVNWEALAQTWVNRERAKNPNLGNPELGVGEYRDSHGRRTYENSGIVVPESATPRPGKEYWWNHVSNQWDKAA